MEGCNTLGTQVISVMFPVWVTSAVILATAFAVSASESTSTFAKRSTGVADVVVELFALGSTVVAGVRVGADAEGSVASVEGGVVVGGRIG